MVAAYVSINGELVADAEARLHVSDLTFRRAYGAFDFLRVERGVVLFLDDYLERFARSAKVLRLELPSSATLKSQIHALLEANATESAGIQMFLTGGYTPDGYTPVEPNLVLLEVPIKGYPDKMFTKGVKLISHEYQRDLPSAKTTNYMMAVYLRDDIKNAGAVDALYHANGYALESTRCNLFIVKNGDLITPKDKVLHGVTRKQILKVASGIVPIEERPVTLDELFSADEVFITSSTKGAMPVRQIDDRKIADGNPGKVTEQLMNRFDEHLQAYVEENSLAANI